jgi:hypothetical protein
MKKIFKWIVVVPVKYLLKMLRWCADKLLQVGYRAAISSVLVVSLFLLISGVVFIFKPSVMSFINVKMLTDSVLQVIGVVFLYFSGFLTCSALSLYVKVKLDEAIKSCNKEAKSIATLELENGQLEGEKIKLEGQLKEKEEKNARLQEEVTRLEAEKAEAGSRHSVINMDMVKKVFDLVLLKVPMDITQWRNELKKGGKLKKSISHPTKYKGEFNLSYIKNKVEMQFGVDLKKIKIFKDDVGKEIFVYGVQSKPMGIIKSEIIEGTSLRYTKYFSEQKMLTTDDMSEAEKNVFNRDVASKDCIHHEGRVYVVDKKINGKVSYDAEDFAHWQEVCKEELRMTIQDATSNDFKYAHENTVEIFKVLLESLLNLTGKESYKIQYKEGTEIPMEVKALPLDVFMDVNFGNC